MSSGYIVWHDLYAFDPAAAQPFYRDLFGWTISTENMGGNPYTMAKLGDVPIGGFGPLSGEIGSHPYWNVYFSTPDLDRAIERILANGGTIVHPGFDIPGIGRMAFALDNTGASFSPFQQADPTTPANWPPINPAPGEIVWHDHMSEDPAAAARFYATVFDIDATDWSSPDFTCLGLQREGQTIGVILAKPQPDVPTCWNTYVESPGPVADVKERVVELGGTVLHGPAHHPGFGDFLIIEDPAGGVLGTVVSEMWRADGTSD
ncbi:MAG TPA: VOC family protein [Thermomicrobiales bacterium]|nr:VOC family protein [Thermomicrobiales bacterium]HRA47958.1 VOC family protein [Thermomicrobiales bacterium]